MRLRLRRPVRVALLTFAFLIAASGWVVRPELARALRGQSEDPLVENVLAIIRQHYADSLGERDLRLRAVEGILRSLPDNYSALLRDGELAGYREILEGSSGDVGIRLLEGPLGLTVDEVAAGSPAALRGVRPGDRILAIEDAVSLGWSALRGEQAFRGEPGSTVRVRLRHPGSLEGLTTVLRRERARRLLPATRTLGPGIGYIRLTDITRGTADAVSAAITRMVRARAFAVVLDLRNNPGGLLHEATTLLDRFLDQGSTMGAVEGRGTPKVQRRVAAAGQRWPGLQVVVLVNAATASAAEIIAAGLKENGRGTVVGEHTFGKGMVQSTVGLGANVAVRISTARWLTPSGRPLNRSNGTRGGIEPNLVVPPWHPGSGDLALAEAIGIRADPFRQVLEAAVRRREWTPRLTDPDSVPAKGAARDNQKLLRRLRASGFRLSARQLVLGERLLRQEYAVLVAARGGALGAEPSRRAEPVLPDAQLAAAVRLLQRDGGLGVGDQGSVVRGAPDR